MRILFITMYFPPLNSIASLRTGPMVDFFIKNGIEVDVLTRYYDKDFLNSNESMVSIKETKEIQKPFFIEKNVLVVPFKFKNFKLSIYNLLPSPFKGLYNYLNADVYHGSFIENSEKAFKFYLSSKKYDLIIASFGPPATIKVAKNISKKYKIPYAVDFRDAYINEMHKGVPLIILSKIQKVLLKKASALFFASDGMRDFFSNRFGSIAKRIQSLVIYNGASELCFKKDLKYNDNDLDVVRAFQKLSANYDLILLHTGTIYPGQNISFFLDSLNVSSHLKVAIVFVGLMDIELGNIESENVYCFRKVAHETAIYLQRSCDALLLPIYKDRYTGWSGKTFEYLASNKVVLCSPSPQYDLIPFFNKSGNVIVLNNSEEYHNALYKIFNGQIVSKHSVNDELRKEYWLELMFGFLRKNFWNGHR